MSPSTFDATSPEDVNRRSRNFGPPAPMRSSWRVSPRRKASRSEPWPSAAPVRGSTSSRLALRGVEFGGTGAGRRGRRTERDADAAARLVGEDLAAGVPVLGAHLLGGLPDRRGAWKTVRTDGQGEQVAGPGGRVELRLVDACAGVVRIGVERHRRGGVVLRLDLADDRLEGRRQRRAAAGQIGAAGAALPGHLVERGDRTRVPHAVAQADDIGLHVVRRAAVARLAQRLHFGEDVLRRRAEGIQAGDRVPRVDGLRQRVDGAVLLGGRIAVGGQHHVVALAGGDDRTLRVAGIEAGEVIAARRQTAGERRVLGGVLQHRRGVDHVLGSQQAPSASHGAPIHQRSRRRQRPRHWLVDDASTRNDLVETLEHAGRTATRGNSSAVGSQPASVDVKVVIFVQSPPSCPPTHVSKSLRAPPCRRTALAPQAQL